MASHTALITGSTAGLGAEFARQLASQGYAVVLVARSEERLNEQAEHLGKRYGTEAEVIVADLMTDDGVAAVQERLADDSNPVHVLVNNAGHGLGDPFIDSSLDAERGLVRLHVQTTMELTHTALRHMVARRGGRIINVASVAAFTPTGTYSAAKSWMLNFSKAMHQQHKHDGVLITAVCPGLVRTEFHERGGIEVTSSKRWMWLEPDDVVRQALTANAQGAAQCVPSVPYRALTTGLKFVPDRVVHWVSERGVGIPGQEGSEEESRTEGDKKASNHQRT
ncbi:SDR family NAD(P)-dependent oxidoreductase [Nesterenkonia populi]